MCSRLSLGLVFCLCLAACGDDDTGTEADTSVAEDTTVAEDTSAPEDTNVPEDTTVAEDTTPPPEDTGTVAAATFTEVFAIFSLDSHSCADADCHGPGDRFDGRAAGVDFTSQANAYESLVGDGTGGQTTGCRVSEGNVTADRVVPGDADGSYLMDKLNEDDSVTASVENCQNAMPPFSRGGRTGDPLTTAELEVVRSWIAAGALND